jgi:hypothetical protein
LFRCKAPWHPAAMATLKEKIEAELAGRAVLEQAGIRPPDHVEYGHTCIRFVWHEEKLVLAIQIDEPPEGFKLVGEWLDNPRAEAA